MTTKMDDAVRLLRYYKNCELKVLNGALFDVQIGVIHFLFTSDEVRELLEVVKL